MIRHHEASHNTVFQEEAESIRHIYLRVQQLSAASEALGKGWSSRLKLLISAKESVILEETVASHSYTLPIKMEILMFGLAAGLLLSSTAEAVIRVLYYLGRRRRVNKAAAKKLGGPHNSST